MNEQHVLKESSQANHDVKKSRFSFQEVFLTVIIILIVVAIITPLVVKYVDKAEEEALVANARAMWILVNTALLLDEYSEKDLKDFTEKYKIYRKLSDLKDGTMVIEQKSMSRIKKFNPKEFYIKIELEDSILAKVYVAKDDKGKKSGCFSD